jgi:diguanylate cyclase (GGDEF)-like protein
MNTIAALEKAGKAFWITVGLILLGVVALLDYLTGYELSFSLFYLIPIALFSWFVNNRLGVLVSFISAALWLVVDIAAGVRYSHPAIYFWNSIIRLTFFNLTVLLISLGKALERERTFARTDYTTGIFNTRFFHILGQREIDRTIRYKTPLTVAFVDVDNFKVINDRFGHVTGDKILGIIASTIQRHLRKTDIVARVGGDEFAILLPDVGEEAAKIVVPKMQRKLLDEMWLNNWPVTFSIGVVTCVTPPNSVDEILNMADKLMYSVKNSGKNDIQYSPLVDLSVSTSDGQHVE